MNHLTPETKALIAGMALQGILANPELVSQDRGEPAGTSLMAIKHADFLVRMLEMPTRTRPAPGPVECGETPLGDLFRWLGTQPARWGIVLLIIAAILAVVWFVQAGI